MLIKIKEPPPISALTTSEPRTLDSSHFDIPTYDSNPWSLSQPINLKSFGRQSCGNFLLSQTIPRNSANMRYKLDLGASRDALPPYIPRGNSYYFEVHILSFVIYVR
jgi:hypothetical protein